MFKLLTLSCLLAVACHCKNPPSPIVPYYNQPYPVAYPQGYPQAYPQAYPQVYPVQPKYNAQPAYVAAVPYVPGNYRQVFGPSNVPFSPYYYGYAPYPAYQSQYAYPSYAPNDENQAPAQPAQPGWGEYLSSNFWNYVPNFPSFTSENQQTSEAESQGGSAASSAETPASAEANPEKGNKPGEGQKTEQKPASDEQPTPTPSKPIVASPFLYFSQPQYYGQYPQAIYDPSKLNSANNGAISSFLFYRNQPQPVYPQSLPFADQKYYQVPIAQPNQGTAAFAYQRFLQFQKQHQPGQYLQGQPQQDQYQQQQQQQQQPQQQQQQQQDQPFQQQQFQQQPFQQHHQFQQTFQYDQQLHKDDASVVVDSNATGVQGEAQGQQQAQSKVSTGPTIAVAQPQGIAFAGIGGRAGAGPIGTAIVGKNATAIAGPSATAISLDQTPTISLSPVHKLTLTYVAKYSPELGVYKVAEIKT